RVVLRVAICPPPLSSPFPCTTLFRSIADTATAEHGTVASAENAVDVADLVTAVAAASPSFTDGLVIADVATATVVARAEVADGLAVADTVSGDEIGLGAREATVDIYAALRGVPAMRAALEGTVNILPGA